MSNRFPIYFAITGASGAPYWRRLLGVLLSGGHEVHLTFSGNADTVCKAELDRSLEDVLAGTGKQAQRPGQLRVFARDDFYAPMASGSAQSAGLVIAPCSLGTLGRIANGVSSDLITRAADVSLKERRKLILLFRETPLSLIHLRNMTAVTEAGAIVMPASPGFYNQPTKIDDLVDFMVQRICDQLGVDADLSARWGGKDEGTAV